jgi:hypothetical protein
MMRWLSRIPDALWENLGIAVGAVACSSLVLQVVHEWRTPGPSTVSVWFIGGFFLVYVFWFFYGVRFNRRGIWLPNAAAAVLQLVLAAVVLAKS